MSEKVNLLNFDCQGLCHYLQSLGESSFRGKQLFQWIHQAGVADVNLMTNISKTLRAKLLEYTCIDMPEVVYDNTASDGTRKWLLRLDDGNCIEAVYIPERTRGTLCVSSQVGCALNCSFCSTAKQGFARNLSVAEIISQVWVAVRSLSEEGGKHDHAVTNVVMMGMGEPLLNYNNVLTAMDIMKDDLAYGLAKRRVTLSTSGVAPGMLKLKQDSDVALALSLHAPNDELRNELVPINKKYPLKEIMQICREYFPKGSKRVVTMEYVMLEGINDSEQHAKQLAKLLANVPCKLNLIPFNSYPKALYQCSPMPVIEQFKTYLQHKGILTTIRKTRGQDIDAACGQLAGDFKDKTSRRRLLDARADRMLGQIAIETAAQ